MPIARWLHDNSTHAPLPSKGGAAIPRLLLAALFLAVLCGCKGGAAKGPAITVASADSPEQILLGKLTVLALRDAGYEVVDHSGLDSGFIVRSYMETGKADVCWEYTADTWLIYQAHELPIRDQRMLYDSVVEDDAQRGIAWMAPTACERNMTLLVREDNAQAWNVLRISDIKSHIANRNAFLRLCTPEELYKAPNGISGLQKVYNFTFSPDYVHWASLEEGYQALQDGTCDCAVGYSADPETEAMGLRPLGDDATFFMRSSLAMGARAPVLEQTIGLREALSRLNSLVTPEALSEMTYEVVVNQAEPESVAKRFLREHMAD
ncbi:MAG: ABC transporter substrate-binding protein [Anaerolineae bacterium]